MNESKGKLVGVNGITLAVTSVPSVNSDMLLLKCKISFSAASPTHSKNLTRENILLRI